MKTLWRPLGQFAGLCILSISLSGCISAPKPVCTPSFDKDNRLERNALDRYDTHDPLCLERLVELQPLRKKADADRGQPPSSTSASTLTKAETTASTVTTTTTTTLATTAKPDKNTKAGSHKPVGKVDDPPKLVAGGAGDSNNKNDKPDIVGRLATMYNQGLSYCLYVKNRNALWHQVGILGAGWGDITLLAAAPVASSLGANTGTITLIAAIEAIFGKQIKEAVSGSSQPMTYSDTQALMSNFRTLAQEDERFRPDYPTVDREDPDDHYRKGFYAFRVALENACFLDGGYSPAKPGN